MKTRRQPILDTAQDLMSDFLFYDRKEDELVPKNAIGDALRSGEVTAEEILDIFREALSREISK